MTKCNQLFDQFINYIDFKIFQVANTSDQLNHMNQGQLFQVYPIK